MDDGLAYLRIRQVARYFGVSTQTVLRQVKRGELRVVRFGAQILVPRAEIERIEGSR